MIDLDPVWNWKFGARFIKSIPERGAALVQFGATCAHVERIEFFTEVGWKQGEEQADIEAKALQLAGSLFDELSKLSYALAEGRAVSGKADGDPLL